MDIEIIQLIGFWSRKPRDLSRFRCNRKPRTHGHDTGFQQAAGQEDTLPKAHRPLSIASVTVFRLVVVAVAAAAGVVALVLLVAVVGGEGGGGGGSSSSSCSSSSSRGIVVVIVGADVIVYVGVAVAVVVSVV